MFDLQYYTNYAILYEVILHEDYNTSHFDGPPEAHGPLLGPLKPTGSFMGPLKSMDPGVIFPHAPLSEALGSANNQ